MDSKRKRKRNDSQQVAQSRYALRSKPNFTPGQQLEAKNNNWPLYRGTIHMVEYIKKDEANPGFHKCRALPYDVDNIYSYHSDDLHVPVLASPNKDFVNGEMVHVRLRNRRGFNVDDPEDLKKGHLLDGHSSREGVWVKAVLLDRTSNFCKVIHPNWDLRPFAYEFVLRIVRADDIRKWY